MCFVGNEIIFQTSVNFLQVTDWKQWFEIQNLWVKTVVWCDIHRFIFHELFLYTYLVLFNMLAKNKNLFMMNCSFLKLMIETESYNPQIVYFLVVWFMNFLYICNLVKNLPTPILKIFRKLQILLTYFLIMSQGYSSK